MIELKPHALESRMLGRVSVSPGQDLGVALLDRCLDLFGDQRNATEYAIPSVAIDDGALLR
jgi:hypothetical protein